MCRGQDGPTATLDLAKYNVAVSHEPTEAIIEIPSNRFHKLFYNNSFSKQASITSSSRDLWVSLSFSSLFSCAIRKQRSHTHVLRMETHWHIAFIPTFLAISSCQVPKQAFAHKGQTKQKPQSCCWFKNVCVVLTSLTQETVLTLLNTVFACDW